MRQIARSLAVPGREVVYQRRCVAGSRLHNRNGKKGRIVTKPTALLNRAKCGCDYTVEVDFYDGPGPIKCHIGNIFFTSVLPGETLNAMDYTSLNTVNASDYLENTIAVTGTNFVLGPKGKEMFEVRTVEVKSGTVGQVLYDGKIFWESDAQTDTRDDKNNVTETARDNAVKAAQDKIKSVVEGWFE